MSSSSVLIIDDHAAVGGVVEFLQNVIRPAVCCFKMSYRELWKRSCWFGGLPPLDRLFGMRPSKMTGVKKRFGEKGS